MMKKQILFVLTFFIWSASFCNNEKAEQILGKYLDSTFAINNIDFSTIETELMYYTKKNYKKMSSIEGFVNFSCTKLKTRNKIYMPGYLAELKNLKLLAGTTHYMFDDFEAKVFNIITTYNLWHESNLITTLYVRLHEMNYWELNCFKPKYLGGIFEEFYQSTTNTKLVDKLVAFILIEKLYKRNKYVNRRHLCESRNHKIEIIEANDGLKEFVDTTNINLVKTDDSETSEEAAFIGGKTHLVQYISRNFEYPVKAIENKIEGFVFLSFTITKTGKIDQIKIVDSPDDLLSKEAIRVLSSMPNWKPSILNNKPVEVQYTFPIKFSLD